MHCEAFADACADSSAVGLGGYVKFPSGLKRFFQLAISRPAAGFGLALPLLSSRWKSSAFHCGMGALGPVRSGVDYASYAPTGSSSLTCGPPL